MELVGIATRNPLWRFNSVRLFHISCGLVGLAFQEDPSLARRTVLHLRVHSVPFRRERLGCSKRAD
jgi:hypothetical protein